MFSDHISVLLGEVLAIFAEKEVRRFVDGTLGLGGHSEALLNAHPEMHLLGVDRDELAREKATKRLAPFAERVEITGGSYADFAWEEIDGMLLDLGVSSMQLDQEEKGFSFKRGAPLDMRMDQTQELTAAIIVNSYSPEELTRILRDYGEVPAAHKVAAAIVHGRPYTLAGELGDALKGVAHPPRGRKIHPLTLIFQALRIAVNDELGELERGLTRAIERLRPGGRLAVISFHSLEDRIVKERFKAEAANFIEDPTEPMTGRRPREARVKLITKKPIEASREEVRTNPRARSAKLRAVEKL